MYRKRAKEYKVVDTETLEVVTSLEAARAVRVARTAVAGVANEVNGITFEDQEASGLASVTDLEAWRNREAPHDL